MPSVSKCIKGYDREQILGGLVANMVNKVVRKPFYNPRYRDDKSDIDTLRFFLSKRNKNLIFHSINAIKKISIKEKIPLDQYVGASEESILYFVREIMSQEDTQEHLSDEKIEKNFYKALLASNTHTLAKGKGRIPFPKDNLEMYLASLFLQQFGSVDFLYPDRKFLMMTQTAKCIRFFEFAKEDSLLHPLVIDFCVKYGIKNWWMYPKAIWSIYGITKGQAGIVNIFENQLREADQYNSVIDKLSNMLTKKINKKDNIDYVAFRKKPFIKINKYEYVIFNFQLLIERIYSGLYFDFRDLAVKKGIGKDVFKQYYSTNFSEKSLFRGILKSALKDGYDVVMNEDDCLAKDSSKDSSQTSKPDFYARKGNVVFLFENKDVLFAGKTKEQGTLQDYIDYLKTRFYKNEKGGNEGVLQLMDKVEKIRSGEFQRRWDFGCPRDAFIYPILIVPEAKFTVMGVKNYLQYWQRECKISTKNVKPIVLVDIGTVCLYQYIINKIGLQILVDDYLRQSDSQHIKSPMDINDVPNAMMSFTDYLIHTDNDTLSRFAAEWENYIRKDENL